MNNDPLLSAALKMLLQGEIICSVKSRPLFDFLDDENNRRLVSDSLSQFDRDVRLTHNMDAYVCCYTQIEDPEVKAACKDRFRRIVLDLKPLVEWLCMVMDSSPTGTPIRTGDTLSRVDILKRVEQNQQLCERLSLLAAGRLFNSRSQDAQGQLQQVFNKLTEMNYLKAYGHAGTRYQATGMWSVLYDQLGFIRTHENLDEDDDAEQGSFL